VLRVLLSQGPVVTQDVLLYSYTSSFHPNMPAPSTQYFLRCLAARDPPQA
jgi:hypothetical protein